MIFGRHLVAHVPIDLPATADWETWIVVHVDTLFLSYGVCARYITDVVVEVKVLDVPGILSRDHFHAVLAIALFVEVIAIEFAFEMCANVLQLEVLINSDETPMTHVNSLAGSGQD